MQQPHSKLFNFQKLISENNLCQSWQAVNVDTGSRCLIKTPSPAADIGPDVGKAILSESFKCQKEIRSSRIARAIGKHLAGGSLFIEYPYLDHSEWTALTPELFQRHLQSILPQIGLTVDYLHMLGLVHCDLKLENFLLRTNGLSCRLLMIDLDFLCRENARPKARVLGTPDHIAPEILDNDRIVVQSDMYSFGVSLGKCLEAVEMRQAAGSSCSLPVDECLAGLVREMTSRDPLRRPRSLLESLHSHNLLDTPAYELARKTLLAMLLVSRFRTLGSSGLDTARGVEKFIRRDNKILGPGDELLGCLAAAVAADRRKAVAAFKVWLSQVSVELHADYWHVTTEDSCLLRLYRDLTEIAGGNGKPKQATPRSSGVADALAESRALAGGGWHEHGYLYLRECWIEVLEADADTAEEKETVLTELVSMAQTLNRLKEADQFLEVLFDLKAGCGKDTAEVLYERVRANVLLEQLDAADRLLATRRPEPRATGDRHLEIGFQRMTAWLLLNRGEYDRAMDIFDRILPEAKEHKLHELVFLILYNIGILYWRRGEFKRSDEFLLRSYEVAERENLLTRAILVLAALARLAWEQADYAGSIKYGKLASKVASERRHMRWLPSICSIITNAEIRLADYPKAEYWLQRYLSVAPAGVSRAYLLSYYLQEGYLRFNQGDLMAARDSFHKGRLLLDRDIVSMNAGKVYHNLAEVAVCQGHYDDCEEYLEKGRGIFRKDMQEAALAELDLIDIQKEFYAGRNQDPSRFCRQAVILADRNCRYYALLSLFHAVLNCQSKDYEQIGRAGGTLKEFIRPSGPPLFRAMGRLLEALERYEGEDHLPVTVWKEVFAILLGGRQDFLAMLAGVKIADMYSASANCKHAKKFLLQSRRLAESMGNDQMVHSLDQKLEQVSRSADNSGRLIKSFHGISEILTDLGDYRQSLQRLIKFAVDQTGAERGVLFLKTRDGADLSVAASLNCDDQSLSDIKDFSLNIPHATMKQLAPLIIENALADQRTNRYASIVYHNILSVICVPLSRGTESMGALYLDHHTIPALFDKEDLTFIIAVANFISVTLATARDIRSRLLTNLQMRQDIGRLGGNQNFVTEDAKLLDLFKKLPQIAATRSPVLILGENGTGKEIVGELIHRHSPRHDKPFVKLNCAAIQDSMIESELFGVARNAATDVAEREGRFSAADSGTLYLDEIGDMPANVQSKVLRVLEYQEFQKVGSNQTILTDIRFVYATNHNLLAMVADGRFREDLFYRINTITIEIPPLRERSADVPVLIEHFLKLLAAGRAVPRFSTAAMETLMGYYWPGNVRELKNIVERHCILHPGTIITKEMLSPEIRGSDPGTPVTKKVREKQEAERIRKALAGQAFSQTRSASELGMPISTLRRKMKKYGIRKPF